MTPDEKEFDALAAAAAARRHDNEDVRLVMADWLEEHGSWTWQAAWAARLRVPSAGCRPPEAAAGGDEVDWATSDASVAALGRLLAAAGQRRFVPFPCCGTDNVVHDVGGPPWSPGPATWTTCHCFVEWRRGLPWRVRASGGLDDGAWRQHGMALALAAALPAVRLVAAPSVRADPKALWLVGELGLTLEDW